MGDREYIELEVEVIAKSEKAILISDDGIRQVWIPFSQIRHLTADEVYSGDNITIAVAAWIAKKKELI